MRCLHVASGDLWAGAEASAYNLIVELASRPGLDVGALVLNRGVLADRLRERGIPVWILSERELGLLPLVRGALAHGRRFSPHIVHTHRYKENVLGAVLAVMLGARHVRTAHGLPPEVELNGGLRGLGALLDRGIGSWMGSTWIAVSRELTSRVASIRDRVHVVPNGLPLREAPPDREAFRAAFGDAQPAWYVGFAGRLETVKRPDRFLRVFSLLPGEVAARRVRGIVLGEGGLARELEAQASSLGIADRVRFLGHRPNGENVVAALDVLVVPSDHEGHPMVILESMRAGVPIVASSVGGIPEVLGSREWIVPPEREHTMARAVLRLLEDPASRALWSADLMRRFREDYTIEAVATRIMEIYEQLA